MHDPHYRFELNDVELAAGAVVGSMPGRVPRLPVATHNPREALELAVATAVRRPPCVVSFSGGRDSSVILATATFIARREGLPEPIPVSIDALADTQPDDEAFRLKVVDYLGLADWERVPISDELDWIGPIAQKTLPLLGAAWPPNAHLLSIPASFAAGGSVMSGVFGDEVFSTSPADLRVLRMVADRRISSPRDLVRLAFAASPRGIRQRVLDRRFDSQTFPDWLEPGVARELRHRIVFDEAMARPWTRSAFARFNHLRYTTAVMSTLTVLSDHHGVPLYSPFGDPSFLSAVAEWLREHPSGRTEILRAWFSDVLPDEVLTRRSKADFRYTFFNRHTRLFAESWDGSGCPPGADPNKLRGAWLAASNSEAEGYLANSAVALQHAYLMSTAAT